ncbi:uncharacterized protein ACA1_296040 [Acanthamoeba castellanii str. Neff]|jgi:hypothetical protein|uniref:Uncharacterized protein n=1 Tax=Acanthamoeba castellanii (strain ATCC 30010 / Neff) TaxID=1257118 RepID=L8HJY5_ACACF|nr:uncharacterized protein ACA1_296040 [Acanthamoeba castellanii str. Neff]ELR25517.1 hypothetical protein ACA1_296040 [Acanthamoeba castellanii str. Neff]
MASKRPYRLYVYKKNEQPTGQGWEWWGKHKFETATEADAKMDVFDFVVLVEKQKRAKGDPGRKIILDWRCMEKPLVDRFQSAVVFKFRRE